MQRVILVVSPDIEFLQQLRSHLEEGGRYQVTVALSAHEALNLANSNFFEVAIVDGELDDIPVAAFTRDLAALQSDLKILVFPPDNNPQHPVLDSMTANGFLSKPFSGQEVGKALSSLFSDQPMAGNVQVKVVDDLIKQWLQIPDTGGKKAEQILENTAAQSVLIIIKDQLIASAGSMDEGLVSCATGFLSRYWKDEENSELARFIKLDGDGSERLLYATKLVSNVVLVLVYPIQATLQIVRRELNRVKDDFQKNYPTTAELRQDIAKQTLAEINARNKKLESLQPNAPAFSQNDLDALDLNQQPSLKPDISPISQEEIDLLKVLQAESQQSAAPTLSQAEMDARRLFEQESAKPKVSTTPISQEEIDLLKALQDAPQQPAEQAVTTAELEARKLFEQESVKPKVNTSAISQAEIDALKAHLLTPQPATEDISQAELEARKLFEQESAKPTVSTSAISQAEIDALKSQLQTPQPAQDAITTAEMEARKLFEQESVKPKVNTSAISQAEIDALKAEFQTPQPAADAVTTAEMEAHKLFEQESAKPKVNTSAISQAEIDALKAQLQTPQSAADADTTVEMEARKLFEQESAKPKVSTNAISQDEIDALKAMLQPPQQAAVAEAQGEPEALISAAETTPAVSEQDLTRSSEQLEQLPAVEPQSTAAEPLPTAETTAAAAVQVNTVNAAVASEPLPEIDFELPWEVEEAKVETVSEIPPVPSMEPAINTVVEPVTAGVAEPIVETMAVPVPEPVTEQPVSATEPEVAAPIEALQSAPTSFAEVLSAVTPQTESTPPPPPEPNAAPAVLEPEMHALSEPAALEEPAAPPAIPSLKEFRFNFTCVLIPDDRDQFLARELSEKLSATMPDIHEDQGWHMTGITVRPQYLLWSAAVPLGTCPHRIMQEVRTLTSNLIFAKFPEIAQKKTSNDFWSSKFMAVSGSEPPPANLIFEFVTNAWKTPEATAS